MKKSALILSILLVVTAFFVFDLDQSLTLENIKASQAQFEAWRISSPFIVGTSFLAIYISVAALSLPGAAIMTLTGGALFGVIWGTIIVSFASTIGATLAFIASRFLFKKSIQNQYGNRLQAINRGIEKDGSFYLFTLRLVPVFPFFLVNLLMGLTPIRTTTFFWVSQVGMLAGTIVYVNAGTQLAQISDLTGILSLPLLVSFIVLGVFPILAKKIMSLAKKQQIYKTWS